MPDGYQSRVTSWLKGKIMRLRSLSFLLSVIALFLLSICSCTLTPVPAGTEIPTNLSPTSLPSSMPTIIPSVLPTTKLQLPTSSRLGTILTGSGRVERRLLTYDDLMTGVSTTPVDDSAFALPEEAALPGVVFEGSLQISAGMDSGSRVIRDDLNYVADPNRLQLPTLNLQFVQDGSYLIPVTQGLVYTGNPYWNTIVGPGRIWRELGDRGYARASFPFTLVERNQNCTHNGVMTFLFDGTQISPVRYQVTQETCLYFKFDLWGQIVANYTAISIPEAAAIRAAHATELTNLLPTRPVAALATDYPTARVNLSSFGSGITPEHMTAYGLVINGINYVSGCQTRYGEYAYCEEMRLPSYSTAKSAFAAVALMHLGQKYGTGVYSLLIKDYVPEAALAAGDWSAVTFQNTLDMSTGNYAQEGFEIDESGSIMTSFLDDSETYADKIKYAFLFPGRMAPGRAWIYHTSDTFIATRAMNNFLVSKEGSGVDIYKLVRDEVYTPLHLSLGGLTTLRTDNSPTGKPFGGYGLFWTRDDIAKIALLMDDQEGRINGSQLLESGLLAASMQKDSSDRGLNTSGVPIFKYRNGFWGREWTSAENRRYSCTFWTPFMSGYGGITVVLMPNGSIYYYFSDNNEYSWYDAVNESNKIKPMCP
jgi:hypothetical protein